jgi:ABC-type branched-subunit amino acid transport system ATPase component
MSVLENVMVGAHSRIDVGLGRSLLGTYGSRREERRIRDKAWGLLHFVGLAEKASDPAGSLPFADQRRLEIARALAADPQLLLLDEPAAGMHPSEIRDLVSLIRQIKQSGVTVLLIEHHMDLVMGLSDTISVLDYGQMIAEGSPQDVRTNQRVIEAYLGTESVA